MKKTDLFGIGIFIGIVISLVIFIKPFIWLTIHYPIPMGFLKVAILATYGECLKTRLKTGTWRITHPIQRFIVWGFFGIWFTLAFSVFSAGVQGGLVASNLWPFTNFTGFLNVLWIAFSKSLWINWLGGYAYFMMGVHEYINQVIEKQGLLGPEELIKKVDIKVWLPSRRLTCIPMTILWFWLPAHTFTFMLPGHFRILSAAFLAVALGFILTIKKK